MPLRAPDVHRIVGHIAPVQLDAARIRLRQADRHVERGGFSRAVRPKQADDLGRGDVEADAL
jgi:hypothetical protein